MPRIPVRVVNSSCSVFCDLRRSTMTRKPFLFGKRSCDNDECKSVLTKQQMIDLGISNNIPKLSRKFKRQQNHLAIFIFVCMALGIALYVALIIYLILEKL